MEKKSFSLALLIWFFFGGLGGHRFYIKGKVSVLFYYWLLTIVTFGFIVFIDLFLLKGMLEKQKYEDKLKEFIEEEKLKGYVKEYQENKEMKDIKKIGF